jgi:hypothetical protein
VHIGHTMWVSSVKPGAHHVRVRICSHSRARALTRSDRPLVRVCVCVCVCECTSSYNFDAHALARGSHLRAHGLKLHVWQVL